jgi:hypothetical protein
MTRDDLTLKLGVAGALLVGLATLSEGMVHTLGLPLVIVPALPWIRLAAFLVGLLSAQLGSSPLPGKPADPLDVLWKKFLGSSGS